MNNGFTKGLLIGSVIGASMIGMANSDAMRRGNRKKMMRAGKSFLRRSGSIIGNVADILR